MIPHVIEPNSEAEAELNAFLDARIYEFNVQATGLSDGRPFSSVIKDESNNIIAAINGHTWGGCCHITHLWVHEFEATTGHRAQTAPIGRERSSSTWLYAVGSRYPQLPGAHLLREAWVRPASFDPQLSARSCTAYVPQAAREPVDNAPDLETCYWASALSISGMSLSGTFQKCHQRGVKTALGSAADSGNPPEGAFMNSRSSPFRRQCSFSNSSERNCLAQRAVGRPRRGPHVCYCAEPL